ncbi:uncharacterized protein LOC119178313 isoform X2 [Rhipicephalus microplus]
MKKYFMSERFKDISIADFNYTVRVAMWNYLVEFYNVTISGLSAVERLGSNYIEAEENKAMRIRVALKLEGLNISIAARTKRFLGYTYMEADVRAPVITLVAEIQEANNTLMLQRLEMNNTKELQIQFRFLSPILRILNSVKTFQRYINKKVNERLEDQLFFAVDDAVQALARGHTNKMQCTGCTTFDVTVQSAVDRMKLDPSPLPTLTMDMFARLARVKVTNGTVEGLSRLRQSGDVVARIDECGSYFYANVTIRNLTVTLVVSVSTFMADLTAMVKTAISAEVIIEIVEQNATLVLNNVVVNATDKIYTTVTPIGVVSSFATFLLPSKFVGEIIRRELQPLTRSTIQGALDALHSFAHGDDQIKV